MWRRREIERNSWGRERMREKGGGNAEVSWCGVNGIIAGVQEMETARESVATLVNDVMYSGVIDRH